ncbi:MAG: hypothetical protein H6Q73_1465 [Firmicutes bacterium]|nr:hypothetical protein [Bacillota bacterium]
MVYMLRLLILSLVFLLPTIIVSAAKLDLGLWHTTGSEVWRITFPTNGASELFYPHSGNYIVSRYQNNLSNNNTFAIEAGVNGSIKNATGTDSDWNYSTSTQLWYYGTFQTTGNSYFFNINWKKSLTANSEFFYGYSYRRNNYHMTTGLYYIDNYLSNTPPTAMPALASSYDIAYQGPHFGVTGKTKLSSFAALTGSIAFSPLAFVQGHGWWNLRNLDFLHNGTGQLWDTNIGVSFSPDKFEKLAFTFGFRCQYNMLYQGTENTSSSITWTKATNIQKGYYLTSQFKF